MANTTLLQHEPTPEQLADEFAAQVVKSALKPAPDGLQVFEELAQKLKRPLIDPDR